MPSRLSWLAPTSLGEPRRSAADARWAKAGRVTRLVALVACGLAFYSSGSVHTQSKRPMTLVDLLNIPRVGDPQISPDGKAIAFMLSTPDWPGNRRVAHLWRINTDGSGLRRLSNEAGPPPERAMVAGQLDNRIPLRRQRLRDASRRRHTAPGVEADRRHRNCVAPRRCVDLFSRDRCPQRRRTRPPADSRGHRRAR